MAAPAFFVRARILDDRIASSSIPLAQNSELVMSAPSCQPVCLLAALLFSGCACIWDLRQARVPNLLTGCGVLVGLGMHLQLQGWSGLYSSLADGLALGGFFLLFYLAGGLGAGDVKMMIALGCLSCPSSLQTLLLGTTISGACLALFLAAMRKQSKDTLTNVLTILTHHVRNGLRAHPAIQLANPNSPRFPYALSALAGSIACIIAALSERSS